jgi:hypothetical protein
MRLSTPGPIDDQAWRTSDGTPGVAHFYSWPNQPGATSRCWAEAPIEGTRQAREDDRLCPDCEAWYWEHEAAVEPTTDAGAGSVQPTAVSTLSEAVRTTPYAPWMGRRRVCW